MKNHKHFSFKITEQMGKRYSKKSGDFNQIHLNDKVLGCHTFGESSAEIIQMASIALSIGVTKKDFDSTMALHPTVSEEYVTMY